ncbi:transcriptional regulator, MerR family [Aeromicrobium marinum DSM 15272]|uniref:Transcriptional regulator, MerR family n=1 Tax=Aeromicrobium marinum DSM 15272 TaxID=585531 RepID=E2SDZ0_9ACTN|nr:helix-turn-helix domain-containing protein [Aeromicrobium marinum]EFQ82717.1 transcriptional regulator, MerR family [Aeromicrobium marinum DSM 15272]
MPEVSCYFAGQDEPRRLHREHDDECPDDSACRGCAACPEDHCVVCTVAHSDDQHPLTCAACVAAFREDLDQVVRLSGGLLAHAVLGSGGRLARSPIPGGEAMVLMGPGTQPHGRAWYAEQPQGKRDHSHRDDERETDSATLGLTLAQIEDDWREVLQIPAADNELHSVGSAAAFLDQHLSRMAQIEAGDFPSNASDVATLRHTLEDVLGDGARDEPGAPCVHCGFSLVRKSAKPKLCRHRRLRDEVAQMSGEPRFSLLDLLRAYPALAFEHEACGDQGGSRDRWECLRCRRRYSEDQYRFAVGVTYLGHSPALTAAELERKIGTPATQIRVWGSRGLVAKRGRDEHGVWRYDVAEVESRVRQLEEEQRAGQEAARLAAATRNTPKRGVA